MNSFLPKSVRDLIDEFARLPGIGPKSAQRLTMHLLHSPDSRVKNFGNTILSLKENIQFCSLCWNISESSLCNICSNHLRNQKQICVVEEVLDVVALEKTGEFKGVYHVLHGSLSPVDGIGPEQLKVDALIDRVSDLSKNDGELKNIGEKGTDSGDFIEGEVGGGEKNKPIEVIIATNSGLEGETTALYLARLLKPFKNVRVTRIARGLPVGGDLDYADEMTITRALQGRSDYV